MDIFLPTVLVIAGGIAYETLFNHEEEKEVLPHLPEKNFFQYPMDATFFEDSYILSVKVQKDIEGIIKTENTFQTVINSPEPNFHYFEAPNLDSDKEKQDVNKFELKSQITPRDNELDVDFLYKIKMVEGYTTEEVEEFKRSVEFFDRLGVDLYSDTIKQYEDYFLQVDIQRVDNNRFYLNPESKNCHSDYCSILKDNTKKSLNK